MQVRGLWYWVCVSGKRWSSFTLLCVLLSAAHACYHNTAHISSPLFLWGHRGNSSDGPHSSPLTRTSTQQGEPLHLLVSIPSAVLLRHSVCSEDDVALSKPQRVGQWKKRGIGRDAAPDPQMPLRMRTVSGGRKDSEGVGRAEIWSKCIIWKI